jgi:integrase
MKTRNNVLGSLVCLSLYSQKKLHAIHKTDEKNEFQEVERYDDDPKSEVDIYTPNEIRTLLNAAIEHDVELIPIVVLGAFLGLRPSEAHGEGILATRERLKWGDFVWHDSLLKVTGQKVRAIKPRDIPINEAAKKWL